jgi:hypothetical protein
MVTQTILTHVERRYCQFISWTCPTLYTYTNKLFIIILQNIGLISYWILGAGLLVYQVFFYRSVHKILGHVDSCRIASVSTLAAPET